jgi:Putative peptidoglycan binding domain/Caspase domain
MKKVMVAALVGIVALVGAASGLGVAHASGRVALVIAAEEYATLKRSEIGVKRGAEIAEALRAKGFTVVTSSNPSNAAARAALRDFADQASSADLAVAILIGHGTSSAGQTFFLPVNTEIARATDLLSRGLSVTNVATIAARAKSAAVVFMITTPTFTAPIEGLDPRPQLTATLAGNVVVAFSSSNKVPLSRVDDVSSQSTDALLRKLAEAKILLPDLLSVSAANGLGLVVGSAPGIDLAQLPKVTQPVADNPAATAIAEQAAADRVAADAALQTEKQARLLAEKRVAQEQASKAKADAERALEAEKQARELAERTAQEEQARLAKVEADRALQAERLARETAERRIEEEKQRLVKAESERAEKLARELAEKQQAEALAQAEKAKVTRALEAEKLARELAEQKTQEVKALIEQAKADTERALANAQQAKVEAEAAGERAMRAEAEAKAQTEAAGQRSLRAEANAKQQVEAALQAQSAAVAQAANKPEAPTQEQLASLEIVEAMISEPQRRRIQSRLRKLGHYNGDLDAVMGPLTRQAIADYQQARGAPTTGYLTPEQLQALMAPGE